MATVTTRISALWHGLPLLSSLAKLRCVGPSTSGALRAGPSSCRANTSDRRAGALLLGGLRALFPRIRTVIADVVHESRKLARTLKQHQGWQLRILKRRQPAFKITGLTWNVALPGWGGTADSSKDYEYRMQTSETMIDLAAIRLTLNRIAPARDFLNTLLAPHVPFHSRGPSATAWGASCRTGHESWTESAPTSFNSWTELALNHRQLRFSGVNSCTAAIIGKERHAMKKQIVIGDFGPSPVAPLFLRF